MKKTCWVIFLLPILMLGCTGGGDGDLKGFLPSSVKAQGIKIAKDGQARLYDGQKLFDYMDGGAELYYEYGFEQACVQRYKAPQGGITAEIYQMDTSGQAYGIYTFDSQGEHPSIGQDATYAQGLLAFWKGRYFVRAFSDKEGLKDALLALGRTIAEKIPREGERPDILGLLPPQWVAKDSLIYFRGQTALNNSYFLSNQNVLSLGKDVEGIIFHYTPDVKPLRVIMVRYPGQPQAAEAFETLRTSGVIKGNLVKEGFLLGKVRRGYAGALVAGDLVFLVLEGETSDPVKRALRSIQQQRGEQG
ncbi:MAG: hypothetical protein A2Y65_04580 [Deltaproteobacteria bacterium RBG_13_52_11]|nr:MAG: hypothetical protein A2Y65_04580 [Deltaproteobacteria bacterium RBG_13_52_11]